MTEISAIINFHNEKLKAIPSIRSFLHCCDYAIDKGIQVQKIVVVDNPDPLTSQVIDSFSHQFDTVLEVDHRDLGESRNSGRKVSDGKFLSFFDGDDLWGEEWLMRSLQWMASNSNPRAICHPEVVYYFDATDYLNHVVDSAPSQTARSFHFLHKDSTEVDVKHWKIRYNNLWTSNSFGHREIYEEFPYIKADTTVGFGVEDWAWNATTLYAGIRHAIVPETVHLVRTKQDGSLGQQNAAQNLIPPLHQLPAITAPPCA